MTTDHIELDLIVAFHAGEVPWREVRRRRRRHLDALCDGCGMRTTVFASFLRDRARSDPAARGRCYAAVGEGSVDLAEAFALDLPEVQRDLEDLRTVAPGRRARRVARLVSSRFRSPLLAEALIEESRSRLRHDPRDTLDWLAAARAVVTRSETEVDSRAGYAPLRDLRLRIRAQEANALRVLGELRSAEEVFAELRRRLAVGEPPAMAVSAELASLEASLRYDQRRLDEAQALLETAAVFYRRLQDPRGLAKVLVKRGSILYARGEADRAIPCYEAAAAAVGVDTDPRLALCARHNLVLCLCAVGRPEAARIALEEARDIYRRFDDPPTRNLLLWAEGKIAAAEGDVDVALEHLRAVRDGYAERGLDYDASLACLDLAELHLRRAETREVGHLVEWIVRSFSDRGVEREASRALEMLRRAALAESVTVALIARTRSALLRANRPRS